MATATHAVQLDDKVTTFVGKKQKMLISSRKWVEAASGKTFPTYNPATGEVLSHVAEGDREDIDRAVKNRPRSVRKGLGEDFLNVERGRMMWRLADLIEKHTEEFAQLESLDERQAAQDRSASPTFPSPSIISATTG